MNDLRSRVREARRLTKLSQEEFAARLGVSRSAVANWESGNNSPDLENLLLIAERSGMMFEYLALARGPVIYGAPTLAEEPARYGTISPQQVALLESFDAMSAKRRAALLELTKS